MNKQKILTAVLGIALVCVLCGSILSYSWGIETGPVAVPFGLSDGELLENSLNYQLFEVWGPILLILGSLMFGAMIAGICISKEKEEDMDAEVKE